MSHTYRDTKSGVTFRYNSDLSGDVVISIPADVGKSRHKVHVPGDALSSFWAVVFNGLLNTTEAHTEPVEASPISDIDSSKARPV